MAKRNDRRFRIRYNTGIEGCGPDEGKAFDAESYVLETWDEDTQSWGTNVIAPFRRCVEYPNAEEPEFIHYSILTEIFRLLKLGYTLENYIA
jgi:hypothetical protein